MVRRMRARLRKTLPVALIALAMQVLAPVAACWAAGAAIVDPLRQAMICHNDGAPIYGAGGPGAWVPGSDDQTGAPGAHAGSCLICCLAQANASFDAPEANFSTPFRYAEPVVWHKQELIVAVSHSGSNAQARAPPNMS